MESQNKGLNSAILPEEGFESERQSRSRGRNIPLASKNHQDLAYGPEPTTPGAIGGYQRRSRVELLRSSSPRPKSPYTPIEPSRRRVPNPSDVTNQLNKYFPKDTQPMTNFKPKKFEKKIDPSQPLIPIRIPYIAEAEAAAKAPGENLRLKLQERKDSLETSTSYMNAWIQPGIVTRATVTTPLPLEPFKNQVNQGELSRPRTPGRRQSDAPSVAEAREVVEEKETAKKEEKEGPDFFDVASNAADYFVQLDSYFCLNQQGSDKIPQPNVPATTGIPLEAGLKSGNIGIVCNNFQTQMKCDRPKSLDERDNNVNLRSKVERGPKSAPARHLIDHDHDSARTSISSGIFDCDSDVYPEPEPEPASAQESLAENFDSESSLGTSEAHEDSVSEFGELRDLRSDELEAMGIHVRPNQPSALIRPRSPMPSSSDVKVRNGSDERGTDLTYILPAPTVKQFDSSNIDWTTLKAMNLHDLMGYDDLMELFPKAIGITYPVYDRDCPATQRPKRYAYILFSNAADATMAVDKFDGHSFLGMKMSLEYRLYDA